MVSKSKKIIGSVVILFLRGVVLNFSDFRAVSEPFFALFKMMSLEELSDSLRLIVCGVCFIDGGWLEDVYI